MTRARSAAPRCPRALALTLRVSEALEREVGRAGADREICGLLGGALRGDDTALATTACPMPNRSLRRREFEISISDLRRHRQTLRAAGLHPLVLYHSHPSGSVRPSLRDLMLSQIIDMPLLIIARRGRRMHAACYGPRGGSVVPVAMRTPRRVRR